MAVHGFLFLLNCKATNLPEAEHETMLRQTSASFIEMVGSPVCFKAENVYKIELYRCHYRIFAEYCNFKIRLF